MIAAVTVAQNPTSSHSCALSVSSVASAIATVTATSCWTVATCPPPRRSCAAKPTGSRTPNTIPQPASSIRTGSHSGDGAIAVSRSMIPKLTTSDTSNARPATTRNGTVFGIGAG